ncbi:hypothetical protein Nepgr_028202 [Nepenthes gracilis]|uniref:Uncharacterized protein n=1 Tax=Nepenthes gracilis TaxID=150966 RepID=A0AAD3TCD7_NEPGR|nr:hypothetical protein Nepgr_028202 [Nepenthes gracilis]
MKQDASRSNSRDLKTAVPPHADWPSAKLDGEPLATVLNTGNTFHLSLPANPSTSEQILSFKPAKDSGGADLAELGKTHVKFSDLASKIQRAVTLQLIEEDVAVEIGPQSFGIARDNYEDANELHVSLFSLVTGLTPSALHYAIAHHAPKLVTPEQVNNFISNLNLLDQIGSYELNHIFAHSQRLNSDTIVSFVKALCKVAMSELQSPTDPRVFSLTKIVEVAHYNMNRIRLVWSRIWNVLSDFFVSVGLSENLSVAIFVIDSLRQLAMKFLEREELANYKFQNEFFRPFVVVMQKSSSAEIRELIVWCISQMVLIHVSNVKSGWKSMFMVFTAAAADERKSVVALAFETMEKIVREYFPFITETESMTFTDCVRCLITFTSSRFNSDVSLNAIAFLRFCAVKLAEVGLVCNEDRKDDYSYILAGTEGGFDGHNFTTKDENVSFWMPLLSGLSKLTSDPRAAIRKSSLEVLFNILKDHIRLFSRPFWSLLFKYVIFPIFNSVDDKNENKITDDEESLTSSHSTQCSTWDSQTTYEQKLIFQDDWREIFLALKETAASTIPGLFKVVRTLDGIEFPDDAQSYVDLEVSSEQDANNIDVEDDNLQTMAYVVSRMKSHISVQLFFMQVMTDLYRAPAKCHNNLWFRGSSTAYFDICRQRLWLENHVHYSIMLLIEEDVAVEIGPQSFGIARDNYEDANELHVSLFSLVTGLTPSPCTTQLPITLPNYQRLNSDAIVSFVKALCKVAMSELQSPTDPRVFSLTKIVEVAHYNMNRIRLVWSRIWNVLSDFFVSVGLSENLSVAIFVIDSLRDLQ